MAERPWDYLIAGGGASGMSLACHLLDAPLGDFRLLVVDRDPTDDERRTFSFWAREPTVFDGTACRQWRRLQVRSPRIERRVDLGPFRYATIRGADFQRFARRRVREDPRAELLEGGVEEMRDGPQTAAVRVGGTWLEARWVFDSLPHRRSAADEPPVVLRQRFRGWEVETPADAFDPELPTFFDFRTPQREAVRFFYVLPYAARHALVEYVAYGPDAPAEALREYLEETLGIREYRVLYDESGASPLIGRVTPRVEGRHVMRIGVHGGRLKASTGYAFVRILRDSAAIVESLRRRGHPFAVPRDRWRYRFLDALMLRVMLRRPEAIPQAFERLFQRNPVERVLRFLDEEASLFEIARLGFTLPLRPFAAALLRWAAGRDP